VTDGGLDLFVTPDKSRPGNAASRLWRIASMVVRKPTPSALYGNGKDGTYSLADARRERDKSEDLLKDGKDPSTEKQLDRHRQSAARPFEQWADEWLAKKVEKISVGRRASRRVRVGARAIVLASHLLNSLVRNSEIRREYLVLRYQQKCQQNGRLPQTFTCVFNAS
jgi:hypothetical protein